MTKSLDACFLVAADFSNPARLFSWHKIVQESLDVASRQGASIYMTSAQKGGGGVKKCTKFADKQNRFYGGGYQLFWTSYMEPPHVIDTVFLLSSSLLCNLANPMPPPPRPNFLPLSENFRSAALSSVLYFALSFPSLKWKRIGSLLRSPSRSKNGGRHMWARVRMPQF